MKEKLRRFNEILFFLLFVIIFISIGITIGYLLKQDDVTFSFFNEKENYTLESCNNLGLVNASYCVRNYVSTFYNYTLRNELKYTGDEGTFEDIKLNGGDCHDYTIIYDGILNNLGFKTSIEHIYSKDKTEGHSFLIVWDNNLTSYCKIDLLNVECIMFAFNEIIENEK